mgnify:CR=1 FL=1
MDNAPTLESLQATLDAQQAVFQMHQSMNVEVFYLWCTAIMIMIHAGFLAYEMGASRSKNALAAGIKNILALAVIIPTFYLFGWWIYNAFPNGFIPISSADLSITFTKSCSISGKSLSVISIIVTCVPNFANAVPNSNPMAPPPTINIDFGTLFKSNRSEEHTSELQSR